MTIEEAAKRYNVNITAVDIFRETLILEGIVESNYELQEEDMEIFVRNCRWLTSRRKKIYEIILEVVRREYRTFDTFPISLLHKYINTLYVEESVELFEINKRTLWRVKNPEYWDFVRDDIK